MRTDKSHHTVSDLAEGFRQGLSPMHLAAHVGAPDEIRCDDGRSVLISGARGSMGSTLPGCYVLQVCDAGGPVEAYDLDARGLIRRPTTRI